ncbi:RNA methyltransferase [Mesonia sp. K7]|uniref:TrmH family RNA methyltransferase n=1 Tax=Mesonia sp. K7 TaxID=2218606 RepID=UPI000DAA06D7|nr:RNA methyltransferase [Mesonia sp. K7]PZD77615.1 RNA methyltransferase [Mesonia sp. K7]
MLTKSQIKLINSLSQKKYRNQNQLFVVEGIKVIKEFLNSSFVLEKLYATADIFYTSHDKIELISEKELQKITNLKTAQTALAVFQIPKKQEKKITGLTLALDGIRDPGNLGTIIRLCDWFDVQNLICSEDTVDCFNEKVVQASMGSLSRIIPQYVDLKMTLNETKQPIFGAFMDGKNIYKTSLPKEGVLVLGNEANGISKPIVELMTQKIAIPQFGKPHTESLNVATATAILLSEFKRSF